HTGGAKSEQLVDVVEASLPLHLHPVAALDDEPRPHGGELALQRHRVESLANLALSVLVAFPSCPSRLSCPFCSNSPLDLTHRVAYLGEAPLLQVLVMQPRHTV